MTKIPPPVGEHPYLTIVESRRAWDTHLWVEGFFEVFPATVIAFFDRLTRVTPGQSITPKPTL